MSFTTGSVSPTTPPIAIPDKGEWGGLAGSVLIGAAGSPASSEGSLPTPLSGSFQSAAGAVRRKPSRRANTAERRATHNAVERARRETLNSRFLDLAALLPNLVSVRRPSKSAIVNSSIALIHTQRRARATAGRELRNLKGEADSLRRQLNEWRERACLPPVEEPMRNAEFLALIALEEEDAEEGEEERAAYAMMEMADDDDAFGPDDPIVDVSPQPVGPMHAPLRMLPHYPAMDSFDPVDAEKLAAWNSHLYTALQWQAAQAQAHAQALFTPPASAHGNPPPFPTALAFQQRPLHFSDDHPADSTNHVSTQTGFDDLAAAAAFQQAHTRAARSASLSSFAPPMRKLPSQGHVPQVAGPFAPMGLLI